MPTIVSRRSLGSGICLLAMLAASCGGLPSLGIAPPGAPAPTRAPLAPGDALSGEIDALWAGVTDADRAGDRVRAVHLLQQMRARLEGATLRPEEETPESRLARAALLETITREMRKRAASQPMDAPLTAPATGDGSPGGP